MAQQSIYSVVAYDLHPLTRGNRLFKFADDTYLVIPATNVNSRCLEIWNMSRTGRRPTTSSWTGRNPKKWCLQNRADATALKWLYQQSQMSSNTFQYELPLLKRKFGERSFSYAGPKAWNDLPFALQELTDTCTFKRQLKTHLFTLAYTNCRTYLC